MDSRSRTRKSIIVFYLLIGYIVAQISWWIFQIITVSKQIDDSGGFAKAKMRMLAGEFAVFFVLLCIGLFYIHRVFKKELELSNKKKNFSLSITHELKTPITTSKLFLESLINHDQALSADKRIDIYTKVYQEQTRLNDLIEKVLLSARMENSEIELRKEITNVSAFVNEYLDALVLEQKLVKDIDAEVLASVDKFYFKSVIQNILDNAAKYSEPETQIIFSLKKQGKNLELKVIDQGRGIANADKASVFEMYNRLENEEEKRTKGTGLGLYIVNQIVKAHKGKIIIEDNPEGKGTVVRVIIPQ